MKRIIRERRLTREEAKKYQSIRNRVAKELPVLIARHHEGSHLASVGVPRENSVAPIGKKRIP